MIRDILQGTAWSILFGAAWFAASLAAALVIGRWMRGPKTPVPGATPSARTTPSARPVPGTGPAPIVHDTGGTEFTIRGWYCGCISQWDGRGALIATTACEPVNWARHEQELREP